MLLLKLKISHNEASNVYFESVIFEGMGHECTHPYNSQTELVTFKPFLTNGSSPRPNLDYFHNTLHFLTIMKNMRTVIFPLPHSEHCFFLISNPQESVATPALTNIYFQTVILYLLRIYQKTFLLILAWLHIIAHQKNP